MQNIFGLNPYLNSLSIQNWNISEIEVNTKVSDASEFIYNIIDEIFEKEYVCVLYGDHKIADELLENKFADMIDKETQKRLMNRYGW